MKEPLTREIIAKMTEEELLSHFDEQERQKCLLLTRMSLSDEPPGKRQDESPAAYRRRCRESKVTFEEEFGLALRQAFEQSLYDGKEQKVARLMSKMAEQTPEEKKESEERANRIADKDAKDHAYNPESGIRLGHAVSLDWDESKKQGKDK